ncbi:trypsin-like peptidase domain-containing protein [bacterium]|nr:trypsin-like peptidase domain-containing protein [bacterium]
MESKALHSQRIQQMAITYTLIVFTFVIAFSLQPAYAQNDQTKMNSRYPGMDGMQESPFVTVGEMLKHAVVFIKVEKERTVNAIPFHEFFGRPSPQPERKQIVPSSGSGVIIDKEGYILTNNHVVEDATKIVVKLADGEEQNAELIGTDPETDLALIKIDKVHPDHVASLGDSDEMRIGDWAIAMGNPLGLEWTLTVGVISAKGRSNLRIGGRGPAFQDFLQTDASINFGNSGGPLANIRGEVIGINTAINTSGQNIGFAIPINMAKEVVQDLRETGSVSRGYLGMLPTELTEVMKEALKIDDDLKGVFVETVEPNTPASEGGLEPADVVIKVDGKTVADVQDFRFRVAAHKPDSKMELTILRNGKEKDLHFVLGDRADYIASARTGQPAQADTWMGITVAGLQSPEARQGRIAVKEGVLITKVENGSAAEGNLSPGDVIVKIGSQSVTGMSDWQKVTRDLKDSKKAVLVQFHPGGQEITRFVALKDDSK